MPAVLAPLQSQSDPWVPAEARGGREGAGGPLMDAELGAVARPLGSSPTQGPGGKPWAERAGLWGQAGSGAAQPPCPAAV